MIGKFLAFNAARSGRGDTGRVAGAVWMRSPTQKTHNATLMLTKMKTKMNT